MPWHRLSMGVASSCSSAPDQSGFLLEQKFSNSWRIRNLFIPDSLWCLHTKYESDIKRSQCCQESGTLWISNPMWKLCIWIRWIRNVSFVSTVYPRIRKFYVRPRNFRLVFQYSRWRLIVSWKWQMQVAFALFYHRLRLFTSSRVLLVPQERKVVKVVIFYAVHHGFKETEMVKRIKETILG